MSSETRTAAWGRPRAAEAPAALEDILAAALKAFARHGYEGVSVRMLNRELGVSHNLIHQRFGSKEGLWYAAVDWGFGPMIADLAERIDPAIGDPLELLRDVVRRFLLHAAWRPELLALMNIEGGLDTDRLNYIYENYVVPVTKPMDQLLTHLADHGRIRPIPLRSFHLLIAHGGAALFTLVPLARRFDPADPLDPDLAQAHAKCIADLVIAGLAVQVQ
ncbi:TetR/AcrR family transcriptional regulator [Rhodococcus pyridinivorans]|uniref:TetR/AcrR family transcriptional regulator n=1 Tax=Rhodococcus pyridinivorans TaxID=103816 RepID=UPI001E43DE30|nr:TetR/AcrR family transcriptional regulator [Rhodococcus pyridinivorans]MCD5422434.1 TetR/AcrR family transcriptional regulator [Rhodococcus pyridinivorans]